MGPAWARALDQVLVLVLVLVLALALALDLALAAREAQQRLCP